MTSNPNIFPAAPPTEPCAALAVPPPRGGGGTWTGLAEWVKAEAGKRLTALLPVMERWDNPLVTRAELEQIARTNWQRVFGESISARHVRRLVARIIERDGGRREWTRRELYLRENPPRQPGSSAELSREDGPLADVYDVLAGFATPTQPTPNELSALWLAAWRWYQSTLGEGVKPKAAKAQLLAFLIRHAAWLSLNRHALCAMVSRVFRKLDHKGGAASAAQDGRRAKRGVKRKPEIPQDDALKLAAYATFATGGRLAQAGRELVDLRDQSGLSEATRDLLDAGGSKSYVNRRVAEAVQPLIRAAAPHVLGRKAVDDATPSLTRDYSKLRSMQVVTADDWTPEIYYTVENGKGWFDLLRGQVLIFGDVASSKIIAWVVLPRSQYNALDVRSGMNTVCLEQGRPDQFDFEKSLWETAHLVKGTAPRGWQIANVSASDTAGAWENIGVRFNHARRARSKPAETLIGLLQRFMERCPGYCGHREMDDCPEETKRAKLEFATVRFKNAVLAGTQRIDKHFFTLAQWEDQLARLIDTYNNTPQDGRLNGLTPSQSFEEFWPRDNPPVKFDPSCWHLCAHYKRECEVTDSGITFTFGRERFSYFDEALGAHRHRRVMTWFDPSHPEVLGITDLDQKNPFFVQRSNPVDYLATLNPDSAEAEHFRAEIAKQEGFNKPARAVFRSAKTEFNRTFRPNLVERKTAALGREMLAKRNEAIAGAGDEDQQRNRIIRKARAAGRAVATLRDFSDETEAALDRTLKRREQMDKEPAE